MRTASLAQVGYENYHQMLTCKVRNEAYKKAIFNKVKTGDVVVDFGAGTGLLSVWAVQAGAEKVYAIEKTNSIELARKIAEANGCADKIIFINANSIEVELPEKANVLISETLGSFGVDENTLYFTADLKKRLLTEDAVLIPQEIEVFAAAVSDKEVYEKLSFWLDVEGVNFRPAFELFSRKIMVESIKRKALLSNVVSVAKFDLTQDFDAELDAKIQMKMDKKGIVYGVAGWFRAKLDENNEIITSPMRSPTHWKQAFFPFREPINVVKGDVLEWAVEMNAREENSDDVVLSYEYRCTQLENELQKSSVKVQNRNDLCRCGSGHKVKKCCGI